MALGLSRYIILMLSVFLFAKELPRETFQGLKKTTYQPASGQVVFSGSSTRVFLTFGASLSSLGLASPRSQSNFLLVTVPDNVNCDAATLYQRLRERHILVRHFDTPGLRDKLRISVGTEEENAQLEAVIAELLSQ